MLNTFESWIQLLRDRAENAAGREVFVWLDESGGETARLTWGELDERARAVAATLAECVPPGERALLLFPPGLDFVAAFCGCLYAGVVAVPAYPPRGERSLPRLDAIADDCGPAAVLTTAALCDRVAGWIARGAHRAAPALLAVDDLAADAAAAWRRPAVGPDTLAFLQYTSGSTGLPKGVCVTHGNLLHNEETIRRAFGQSAESVVVSWLPLYHDMGLIGGVLQPLYVGARCVLMAPAGFLKRPVSWLAAIDRYRATTSGGPNFGYELVARKVGEAERDGLDLSSWEVAFNGSEPVRPETLDRFARAFAPCGFRRRAFYPCYGLAEATLFVSGGRPGSGAAVGRFGAAGLGEGRAEPDGGTAGRALAACGGAWLGQRLVVVDPESRRPLPEGRVGEVWVAGPSVAAGYWSRPEASERDFAARLAGGEGPFLRTGDLGFLGRVEGEDEPQLFVTGRIKDLIILRGRNVYPQDVEATVEAAHAALSAAGAAAFAVEADGEERLVVACEVRRSVRRAGDELWDEVEAAVRQAVFEEHEAALHDLVLLRPGALPRTTSGKVRRAACREAWEGDRFAGRLRAAAAPAPVSGPTAEDATAASAPPAAGPQPAREVREALAAAAAAALGRPAAQIAADRSLTAQGLDSLAAAELVRAAEEAGVAVDLAEILEGASLAELSRSAAAPAAAPADVLAGGGATPAEGPLSVGQQALWFLHRLDPASAAYHIAAAADVEGELDPAALGRALAVVGERHPALRATFHATDGEPVQRLAAELTRPRVVEAATWSEERLEEALRDAAYRPFDLARGALRLTLFRRAPEAWTLVLAVHHLVADFWTLALVADDLEAAYVAAFAGAPAAPAAPPSASYADWIGWQRRRLDGPRGEELIAFWRRALDDGRVPDLELPADRPRPPVRSDRGDAVAASLDGAAADAVRSLAAAAGATPFTVLMAAFQATLSRLSGQSGFAVGTPVANRGPAATAALAGYFANPVVLRADTADDPGFDEHLARVRRAAAAAFAHQEMPFARLAERLRPVRDPSRTPLFQAMLTLQGAPRGRRDLAPFALGVSGARGRLGPLALRSRALARPPAAFDLSLVAAERDGGFGLAAVFDRDLFDAATVDRLLGHLATLLAAAAERPETRLSELPLLAAAERRQLVAGRNDSARPVPAGRIEERVLAQARRTPAAPAVTMGDRTLSYEELATAAGRLAARLARLGVRRGDVVGVFVERSPEMVVALLAVLAAGAAYLPLDPAYPAERVRQALDDSGAVLVVAERALVPALDGSPARLLLLDGDAAESAADESAAAGGPPAPPGDADDVAYLIYTSGSTGRPKGVAVPHRAMVNFLASMAERPGLAAGDVLVSVTTISFDIAGLELFGPLSVGGHVVVADRATAGDGRALGDLLAAAGATGMQATPSTWRLLLAAGWQGSPRLTALCGGEALPRELADRLLPRVGALWNLYGPTETTVWSAVERVLPGDGPVPLGAPLANTDLHVVDRRLEPLPPGVAGELVIGGAGVARGYHGRPALTAERFVPHPFAGDVAAPGARLYRTGDLVRRRADGRLEFLGRLDQQVKLRGHRIELGEVEAALAAHPAVAQAVAAVREVGPGDSRLTAWLVPAGEERPPVPELRASLGERLPDAFVPSVFVFVEALPLTANGKVDRRALPEPAAPRSASAAAPAAPRSELEAAVAALWRQVLGVESLGVHDNFFDLGGHSLLLARVHAGLVERGHDLAMVELFRHPTVASLAERLSGEAAAGDGPAARGAGRARARRAGRGGGAVAVVGMAGRFPGAASVAELWDRLVAGDECIRFFDRDELAAAGVEPDLLDDPRYVPAAGLLDDAGRFDAAFFGYTPREAERMDPQHRVFLECAWQALEDAGHAPGAVAVPAGVFSAVGLNTYLLESGLGRGRSLAAGYQAFLGNDKDFVATRVSYELDLKGPSIDVQTACSSSLVAVHLACQSLLAGECDLALAGGATVRAPQVEGYLYEEGGIPSPDGHCRAFDEAAAGTVFGSGVGVVVLKRLDDALADGDTVRGVLLGTAVNNDGAGKVGFTAPGVEGQAAVIAEALAVAGAHPETIGYVEAHGTGTALGDPIEVAALSEAYRGAGARRSGYCALGSVKTNLGHLDTAAGVTGLIKAVLALEHRHLPPSLHFERPNPRIDLAASPFFVAAAGGPWRSDGPRRAAVSSFGIGGTNAHVVLEEAPPAVDAEPSRAFLPLVVSARTESAAERLAASVAASLSAEDGPALADVAWTLASGRRAFAHRRAVVAADRAEAAAALAAAEPAVVPAEPPPVVFLFPGQGAQHPGMARGLYDDEAVFRRELDACAALAEGELGFDLRELLLAAPDDAAAVERLRATEVAQPALFAVEYALARQWMAWGVRPAAFLGHSVGEYVAACLAGVFDLPDALTVVAARGRSMAARPPGGMLAVDLAEEALAARLPAGVEVAAVNAPASTVVAGPEGPLGALAAELAAEGVRHRRLETSHAFHSAMMEPAVDDLARVVAAVERAAPRVPFLANPSGDWITAEQAVDPRYWGEQMRRPVRFAAALARLVADGPRVLLEVGPGRSLTGLARLQAPGSTAIASLPHPRDPQPPGRALAAAVARLWAAGVAPDWAAYWSGERRRRVPLPAYPFEGRSYWLSGGPRAVEEDDPDRRRPVAEWLYAPEWRQAPPPPALPAAAAERPWLIVLDALGAGDALAGRLRERGARVATVAADDVADDAGWKALFAALADDGGWPGHIVHAAFLGDPPAGDSAAARAADLERRGFGGLLALARALERAGAVSAERPVELTVAVSGLARVAGDEAVLAERALLLGAVRVLPREVPGLACRAVDLAAAAPSEDLADDLAAELAAPPPATLAAWRGGRRWVEEHARLPAPPAGERAELPLPERAAVLITGGTGGVGLELAAALAGERRARLALVGRTPLPPRGEWEGIVAGDDAHPFAVRLRRLLEIEALGGEVLTLAADVTDRQALAAAVAAAEERFGPLDAVVHAAGVAGGGLVQTKTAEAVSRVLAPKVAGALALAEALAERPLGLVVLCSSINAVVGGFGQSDYCAANAFLDGFAEAALARRGRRVMSIAWDRWRGVGMAADATGGFLAALGLPAAAADPLPDEPLLDHRLPAAGGREVFVTELAPERHWVLSEHRVLGTPTVPGTTYLEMARAAFRRTTGAGAVELSEVAFLAPLAVPDGGARRVTTVLEPSGESWTFRIGSDGPGGHVDHARGRLRAAEGERPARRDPAAIEAACTRRRLSADDAAARAAAGEEFLVTGRRWQCLAWIAEGEGQALCRLALPAELAAEAERFTLHPALLDVATGAVRLLAAGDYLPLAYDRMVVRGPLPATGYSHLTLGASGGGDLLRCDLAVLDDDGEERVTVTGFAMRRVGGEAAARLAADAAAASAVAAGAAGDDDGMEPGEAIEAFRRALAAPRLPRLVVSTRDLPAAAARARRVDREAVAGALSRLAPAAAAAAARPADAPFTPPADELESTIAAVWQRVLGVDRVGANDNFFELGGTSLAGIQLVAELGRELGREIPTVSIFEAPTVASLARSLRPASGESAVERAHGRAAKKAAALAARRPTRPPRRRA